MCCATLGVEVPGHRQKQQAETSIVCLEKITLFPHLSLVAKSQQKKIQLVTVPAGKPPFVQVVGLGSFPSSSKAERAPLLPGKAARARNAPTRPLAARLRDLAEDVSDLALTEPLAPMQKAGVVAILPNRI